MSIKLADFFLAVKTVVVRRGQTQFDSGQRDFGCQTPQIKK